MFGRELSTTAMLDIVSRSKLSVQAKKSKFNSISLLINQIVETLFLDSFNSIV